MSNLALGAAYKGRKLLPTVIPASTLPDIHPDSIIVGVCGTTLEYADPSSDDGWFISDFCAFSYLLKDATKKQTWITTFSEDDLLQFIEDNPSAQPGFLHGNPYNDRKIVFNRDLVERRELSPFTVRAPSEVTPALLTELENACKISLTADPPTPVLILLFCHGLDSLAMCLDYSKIVNNEIEGSLTIDQMRAVASPGVPITLVTTACYSGGWAIRPDLNMTILTAAGAPTGNPRLDAIEISPWLVSQSWNQSASIGRACGSIFASTLIYSLTERNSLLPEPQESPSSATPAYGLPPRSLQPPSPTEDQSRTYDEFCKIIVQVLGEKITRRPFDHSFRFAAQDDEWDACWMKRTGIPLVHFQRRWESLSAYPCSTPNNHTNLDPSNPLWPHESPTTLSARFRTGGFNSLRFRPSRQDLRSDVDFRSPQFLDRMMRIKAAMLVSTCPGDWDKSPWFRLRGQFQKYARGAQQTDDAKEYVRRILTFRLDAASFVDTIVANFKLVRPLGQSCLDWDRHRWFDNRNTRTIQAQAIWNWMTEEKLEWNDLHSRDNDFIRAKLYLFAALFDSTLDSGAAFAMIQTMGQLLRDETERMRSEVFKEPRVRNRARQWLETLGKRLRPHLAVKRDRSDSGPNRSEASGGAGSNRGHGRSRSV